MGVAGYYASTSGQFSCIHCDNLGDFYQERSGQTSCDRCAVNTQRYLGVLSAANKSSCQCKEGVVSVKRALLGSIDCDFLPCRLLQQRGPVRRGTMPFDVFASATSNKLFASVHLAPLRLWFPCLAYIRLMLRLIVCRALDPGPFIAPHNLHDMWSRKHLQSRPPQHAHTHARACMAAGVPTMYLNR